VINIPAGSIPQASWHGISITEAESTSKTPDPFVSGHWASSGPIVLLRSVLVQNERHHPP
jgi:hypothetical protein